MRIDGYLEAYRENLIVLAVGKFTEGYVYLVWCVIDFFSGLSIIFQVEKPIFPTFSHLKNILRTLMKKILFFFWGGGHILGQHCCLIKSHKGRLSFKLVNMIDEGRGKKEEWLIGNVI